MISFLISKNFNVLTNVDNKNNESVKLENCGKNNSVYNLMERLLLKLQLKVALCLG